MSVADPPLGELVSLTYDADGKRVRKRTAGDDKKFIYDFNRLLQETDAADQTQMEYTSTVEEYGDLLSEYDPSGGGSTAYHQYDVLGSTDALLDPDDANTKRYAYRAFGQIEWESAQGPSTQLTFVGRENYYQDSEIELYYLGAGAAGRPYDPATGQFISQDPIGFAAGDENLYRYAGNNPVNATDPSGRQSGVTGQGNTAPLTFAELRAELQMSLLAHADEVARVQGISQQKVRSALVNAGRRPLSGWLGILPGGEEEFRLDLQPPGPKEIAFAELSPEEQRAAWERRGLPRREGEVLRGYFSSLSDITKTPKEWLKEYSFSELSPEARRWILEAGPGGYSERVERLWMQSSEITATWEQWMRPVYEQAAKELREKVFRFNPDRIPVDRVKALATEGLAELVTGKDFCRGREAALVPTYTPGGKYISTIILEKVSETRIGIGYSPSYSTGATRSGYYRLAGEYDNSAGTLSAYTIAQEVWVPSQVREAQARAAVLTFTLHMIPGGALADYLKQGEYGEAAISFVGDVGLLFVALAKIPKFAKYAWALNRAGVATELAVGGARVTQAVGDIIEGDYVAAAGDLGEAFLRLIGVTYGVAKRLTARAPRGARKATQAGRGARQAGRAAKRAAPKTSIRFGKNQNQVSHAFRHIEKAGLNKAKVSRAIMDDLAPLADDLPQGLTSRSVVVDGVRLDYNAFKLPDGTVNVGRITVPKPSG